MPYRKTPLVTGFVYHVYTQGIDKRKVYWNKREYQRFLVTLRFYLYEQKIIKLSHYLVQGKEQINTLNRIHNSPKRVAILAYCLMPNHFHLVLEQLEDKGISKFVADVMNSYSKFFNAKHKRKGSLFLTPFRAVRVESDEQLMHLSRYVHLNPFSSGITQTTEETIAYPYSSLCDYLGEPVNSGLTSTDRLTAYFKSRPDHRRFIEDRADYQRKLESIKHLIMENDLG